MPIRDVAESIGAGLDLPTVSIDADRAGDYVGFLGRFRATDGPASAAITRALLGRRPTGPTLLEDLAAGHYFN
ncbi:MAG TPA: hypothetical protein VHA76_05935 [Solirubrobacterales bacterium]|nr:hypothetical protein [Solirubrobacterales bacterium]